MAGDACDERPTRWAVGAISKRQLSTLLDELVALQLPIEVHLACGINSVNQTLTESTPTRVISLIRLHPSKSYRLTLRNSILALDAITEKWEVPRIQLLTGTAQSPPGRLRMRYLQICIPCQGESLLPMLWFNQIRRLWSSQIQEPKASPDVVAGTVQANFDEALALHQQGQFDQAQAVYENVLKTQPNHFDAQHLLGLVALQKGDFRLADDLIGKAIGINPLQADAHYNRGNALAQLRELDAAIASYDQAIAISPKYAEAHSNRGNALKELREFDAAVVSYDRAIAIKPDYANAYYNRGVALAELKQHEAAVASFDQAIAVRPEFSNAYSNRGISLEELKKFDEAVVSYDRAIAIRPDFAECYSNRGNALKELNQLVAAVASFDRAIAIKPDYAEAHSNRGMALQELKQIVAAVVSYDRAIAIKADYPAAYWNKSLALLLNGDFERGWELYEWRWKREDKSKYRRSFVQPLWLGAQSLKGKTILLYGEQGLGDTIQFCRYVKLVSDLGARVVLEVDKSLASLLEELAGVSELIVRGDALPFFDYHCPLLSLPLAFKTELSTIPCSAKYISTDALKMTHWKNKLDVKTKPRVGLAWSGSTWHKNDHNRSIFLSELMHRLPSGFQYVSLQKETRQIDKLTLESNPHIIRFGGELNDFTDTAALCELMDVVISVDTSVAHLAGALGTPTWILLPFIPDWRWLLDRDDSPWYTSVKLYRQPTIGDWNSVFAKVGSDLAQLIAPDSR